ncbi:hypothetical protein BH09BAC5_BH09BAC5_19970 [soil metagenome]
MKKKLLIFAMSGFAVAASAQITIDVNDIAPAYSVVLQNNDTMPTVLPGNPGTNQTYDLSALNAHSTDTLTFTPPQFTPNYANFPGSNMSVIFNTNQAYIYFNVTPSIFEVTGQSFDPLGNGLIDMSFDNFETNLNFPTNYNSAFTDMAHGTAYTYLGYDPGIGFQVDSVRIHSTVIKNSIADGWGSAITPLGTYNVLRVNALRRQVDTIDIQTMNTWIPAAFSQDDSVRSYTYYANGIGFPLAVLNDQSDFGTITSATWIPAIPQQIGISEFANTPDMNVFPNPTVDKLNFVTNSSKVILVNLMNANGQIVRSVNVTGNQTTMDVSDLATGIYFYNATDVNGTILEKGKVNITH